MRDGESVLIDYTNYKGERGIRSVIPVFIFYGSNEWHPENQWMLAAYDIEKKSERFFAMRDIHEFDVKLGDDK